MRGRALVVLVGCAVGAAAEAALAHRDALERALTAANGTDDATLGALVPEDAAAPRHVPLKVAVVALLLLLSATFSGLGLGLMSLDLMELEIIVAAGDDEHASEQERRDSASARRIVPLRQQGNLLLTTLLLGNVSVNSLTSILMAELTTGIYGFLVSTALIVVFGEIVPQALCTKYALAIGGRVAPLVRALLALFYVFAKPVSLVLDAYLGKDIGTVFTKRQLVEMIEIHESQQTIDADERAILRGAMSFRSKTARAVMTPVDQVFMLSLDATLDAPTIHDILRCRFSRILVFDPSRAREVVGTIHVKDLVFVDPKESVLLASFLHIFGRSAHHVAPECTLDTLLQTFKAESTHLALVKQVAPSRDDDDSESLREELLGIVTLEDVLEEILQDEILDEGDVQEADQEVALRKDRLSRRYADAGRLRLADLCSSDASTDNIAALARHLQETSPVFRAKSVRGVEIRLDRLVDFLAASPTVEFGGAAESHAALVLRKDVVTRFCLVLLRGRLVVDASGDGSNAHEVGPWSVLAADSLVVQDGLYAADCSVRTVPGVTAHCVRIERSAFQQQLLHPLSRRAFDASPPPSPPSSPSAPLLS